MARCSEKCLPVTQRAACSGSPGRVPPLRRESVVRVHPGGLWPNPNGSETACEAVLVGSIPTGHLSLNAFRCYFCGENTSDTYVRLTFSLGLVRKPAKRPVLETGVCRCKSYRGYSLLNALHEVLPFKKTNPCAPYVKRIFHRSNALGYYIISRFWVRLPASGKPEVAQW